MVRTDRAKETTRRYRKANPEKVRAWKKAYYLRHRDKLREKDKAYYAANKPKCLDRMRARYQDNGKERQRILKRSYLPAPTRPEPLDCECCGKPPGKKAMALDHCHVTGKFRGWLCSRCNAAIGGLGDTLQAVLKAVAYLERTNNT